MKIHLQKLNSNPPISPKSPHPPFIKGEKGGLEKGDVRGILRRVSLIKSGPAAAICAINRTATILILLFTISFFTSSVEAKFLFFGRKKTEAEIKQEEVRKNLKNKIFGKKLNAISEVGKCKDKKAVSALIYIIKNDKSVACRQDACEALGRIGDSGAVPALISVLTSKEAPQVKIGASLALEEIGSQEARDGLRYALKEEEHKGVKMMIMKSLSVLKDTESINIIRRLAKDKDKDIRSTAVYSLGKLGDKETVLEAMNDEDEKVRERAVDALGRMGEKEELKKIRDRKLKKRAEMFLKRK